MWKIAASVDLSAAVHLTLFSIFHTWKMVVEAASASDAPQQIMHGKIIDSIDDEDLHGSSVLLC